MPGSLARAGDVNTQFQLVQNAFDAVNASGGGGIGTDSGTVNAVVLTMTTTRLAYNNGDQYVFTPAVQNTGATTINVDGLGNRPLVRFNGTALQAADLLVNTWYTGRYNTVLNSIEVTSPAAYTSAAGIVSTASPTHKVGLTAAGGTSVNVLPIDVTFAIDQAISPTWVGVQTFAGSLNYSTVTSGVSLGAPGMVISNAGAGTDGKFWDQIISGTQMQFRLTNDADSSAHNWLAVTRSGIVATNISFGNAIDNPAYSFLGTGTATFTGSISAANFTGLANPSGNIGLTAVNGSATTAMRSDGHPALDQSIVPTWTGQHTFNGGSTTFANSISVSGAGSSLKGGVTITTPASGSALTATGAAGAVAMFAQGAATAGSSFGINVNAGTTAADYGLRVQNQSGSVAMFTVGGAGNVVISAPSSGVPLVVNGVNTGYALQLSSTSAANVLGFGWNVGNTANAWNLFSQGNDPLSVGTNGTQSLFLVTAGTTRVNVNGNGAISISAPSSGAALTANGSAGADTVIVQGSGTSGNSFGLDILAGTTSADASLRVNNSANSRQYFQVRGDGVVFGNDGTNLLELGYKDVPINLQSSNYTLVVSDRGKMVQAASGGLTFTAPASVFPNASVVTFLIGSGASLTIAQGSGLTMQWVGNGATTGNRTLTGPGLATIVYASTTVALISGGGLT